MILDIHTHHALGEETEPALDALDRLLASAAAAGIDRICLLGNVFRYGEAMNADEVGRVNDTTISLVEARSERVSGCCFVNPRLGASAVTAEIRRCVAAGLRGVKLEVDVNAQDERLDPVMRTAAELGVMVVQHAWYLNNGQPPNHSSPADVAVLAARHPETTILMPHLTGAGIRGVLDIQPYPNVHIDTSGGQPVAGLVEYAVEILGPRRVLFGSDVCVRDFAVKLAQVQEARLTASQRRRVLADNAARLLGLEGAD